MSYEKLAKDILKTIGGEENVSSLAHCATRLRFKLKDSSLAKKSETQNLAGVITVVEGGGQYQVVIGNTVGDVYKEILKNSEIGDGVSNIEGQTSTGNWFNKAVDIISGIFTPFLGALAASGILKGLLLIFTTVGWMSKESGNYSILYAAADSIFYFLPIAVAITSARKFGANQFVALAIAGALIYPNIITLYNDTANLSFFGIPVILMSYVSSVIPVVFSIWILSILEKYLNRVVHSSVKNFINPLICLVVIFPLTLIVVGPIGIYASLGLAKGITFLYDLSPIISGIVLGAGWQLLVVLGIHWAFVPIFINNISVNGYDSIKPLMSPSNFAQAGAALGVFLKTKNSKVRAIAGPAAVTGLFGITEPIIYGISLRYKKPMIWGIIGGAIGGGIAGAAGSVAIAPGIPGLATIPIFYGPGFGGIVGAFIIAYVFTAVTTYLYGYNDTMEKEFSSTAETKLEAKPLEIKGEGIASPITGKVIQLSEVKDPVFSSQMMGQGIAIVPEEGKVMSPISGTVMTIFPSKHAIGLISDNGVELLIHIGLETVNLNGDHFNLFVSPGDRVEKGQLLVEFDIEKIKDLGYDMTTPVIVTNSQQYTHIDAVNNSSKINISESLLDVRL
jgi:PTS system beta-glucosides-specific IIC component